jgi:drug/metabolite transporter (DMT)-like permease
MGEFFALLTAAFWAGAVILFKRTGETLPPLALNLLRVGVSSVLLLGTMLALGQTPWRAASTGDLLLIAASGLIAIALSDTLFHASLNRIGASLAAIVDCAYSPLTALFAFLLLSERLTAGDMAGMALVVGAVVVTTRVRPPAGADRRTLIVGVMLGVMAMASLAVGIVIVKPVLARQPVVWVTAMRQFAALAALLVAGLFPAARRSYAALGQVRMATLKYALPGTFLGSYLSLMAWIAGMKYTGAGVAAVLNQTATVYIIILARVVLKEPLTKRRLTACGMAVAGVLSVILY